MIEQEIKYTLIRDIVRKLNNEGIAVSAEAVKRYCKNNAIEMRKSAVMKTQARDICVYFGVTSKKSKMPTAESYQCGLANALGYPT